MFTDFSTSLTLTSTPDQHAQYFHDLNLFQDLFYVFLSLQPHSLTLSTATPPSFTAAAVTRVSSTAPAVTSASFTAAAMAGVSFTAAALPLSIMSSFNHYTAHANRWHALKCTWQGKRKGRALRRVWQRKGSHSTWGIHFTWCCRRFHIFTWCGRLHIVAWRGGLHVVTWCRGHTLTCNKQKKNCWVGSQPVKIMRVISGTIAWAH